MASNFCIAYISCHMTCQQVICPKLQHDFLCKHTSVILFLSVNIIKQESHNNQKWLSQSLVLIVLNQFIIQGSLLVISLFIMHIGQPSHTPSHITSLYKLFRDMDYTFQIPATGIYYGAYFAAGSVLGCRIHFYILSPSRPMRLPTTVP